MSVSGKKLANADRRLLASMCREERWQQVKVPITSAVWDVWGRYCELAGISMGRGIAALINLELEAVAESREEVEDEARLVRSRAEELDRREADLAVREEAVRRAEERQRRPSRRQLEKMAEQIEPADPGWLIPQGPSWEIDRGMFQGVGRNQPCPCRSGLKYKRCHGAPDGPSEV